MAHSRIGVSRSGTRVLDSLPSIETSTSFDLRERSSVRTSTFSWHRMGLYGTVFSVKTVFQLDSLPKGEIEKSATIALPLGRTCSAPSHLSFASRMSQLPGVAGIR